MEDELKEKREKVVKVVKNFFTEKDEATDEIDLKEKRDHVVKFIKKKKDWIVYIVLAIIIGFGIHIRTQNLGNLKDVTSGKYIPMALDPHIFLKYANIIWRRVV